MKITKYRKTLKYTYIRTTIFTLFACLFFIKGYVRFEKTGDNLFHIFVNGAEVGTMSDPEAAEDMLMDVRREIAAGSGGLVLMDVDMSYTGEELLWGTVDEESLVRDNMERVLRGSVIETMQQAYTLKVNDYMVNLASVEEVEQLLQAAVDKYDSSGQFGIELTQDNSREFNVLSANIVNMTARASENGQQESALFPEAGICAALTEGFAREVEPEEKDFDDYDRGIMSMEFPQEVEIVEAYLPTDQRKPLLEAIEELTVEQEQQTIYTVVSGDTLSEIAIAVNIPMEEIVAMNDSLETINSIIREGQELIITVPEPTLSVERREINYYEEIYDAEIIYIENDDWYTNQSVTREQPHAGFRKVVVEETYVNDTQEARDILLEEVIMEAVAKVVERGTKVPPTYIKPISGGRFSSGFGRRSAPTKGASTYHKGVDWATPTGTPVYASCGGVVSRAGWGSGYGYVVYIDHEDGRQTRYGHLSRILVQVGDVVAQGDRIALSGSTGVSTGPHLHFEILIGGSQVNPLNYLE